MSEIERFEERTPDGRLASVGVAWTECREGVRGLVLGLMFLSTIIGTFTALLGAAVAKPWWLPAGIGLALVMPIFFFDKVAIAGRPRRLVFHRDGRMEAPLGFEAYAAKYKSVGGHNADVVSIEARQTASPLEAERTPFSHGVVIFMRNGDVAYVAGRLHRDSAHKLSVQMTQALTALREDMAADAMGQGATRRELQATIRTKAKSEELID